MKAKFSRGMVVQNYPTNWEFNYVIIDKVRKDGYDTRQVFLNSRGTLCRFSYDFTSQDTLRSFCVAPVSKAKFEMLYSLATLAA